VEEVCGAGGDAEEIGTQLVYHGMLQKPPAMEMQATSLLSSLALAR
jgi:hypothetical protein